MFRNANLKKMNEQDINFFKVVKDFQVNYL